MGVTDRNKSPSRRDGTTVRMRQGWVRRLLATTMTIERGYEDDKSPHLGCLNTKRFDKRRSYYLAWMHRALMLTVSCPTSCVPGTSVKRNCDTRPGKTLKIWILEEARHNSPAIKFPYWAFEPHVRVRPHPIKSSINLTHLILPILVVNPTMEFRISGHFSIKEPGSPRNISSKVKHEYPLAVPQQRSLQNLALPRPF